MGGRSLRWETLKCKFPPKTIEEPPTPCLWGQDLADGLGWIARNWVIRLDPDESSVIGPVLKKAPVAGAEGGACVILEEKGSTGGISDHKGHMARVVDLITRRVEEKGSTDLITRVTVLRVPQGFSGGHGVSSLEIWYFESHCSLQALLPHFACKTAHPFQFICCIFASDQRTQSPVTSDISNIWKNSESVKAHTLKSWNAERQVQQAVQRR